MSLGHKAEGDLIKAQLKLAAAQIAVMKEAFTAGKGMSEQAISESEKEQLSKIELMKVGYDTDLALGKINAAQMIEIEKRFEVQRLEIQMAAQQARVTLAAQDPAQNAVALQKEKDKLLEIERAHALKMAGMDKAALIEKNKDLAGFYDNMKSGFEGVLKGLLTGTMTLKEAFKATFKSIVDAFAGMATKMAAQWLMTQLQQKLGSKIAAMTQIATNAAVAGSAAFAATAAIPFIGPELAPAASAAAYAGAMSYMGLASARNGFDIPAGMNPITQLHEKEMVLPQAQADAVRDMAAGGGGTIQIHGSPDDSIKMKDLGKLLKKMNRNFEFV